MVFVSCPEGEYGQRQEKCLTRSIEEGTCYILPVYRQGMNKNQAANVDVEGR